MNSRISLSLLNNRPRVELDGVDVRIPDTSLELLTYIACENQWEYDRDELTKRFYGSLEFRENFRKTALGNLPSEIKEICIRPAALHALGYDGSKVYVDALEFEKSTKAASHIQSLAAYNEALPQLLQACDLYQDHFLNHYSLTLYPLQDWLDEKQARLRELFHSLLEKMTQYEIIQGRYDHALQHAERWHYSQPDSEIPLQYLIWLGATLDSYSKFSQYLNKLETSILSHTRVIGYSADEWQRLTKRGMKPDLDVLKLNKVARIEVTDLLKYVPQDVIGRDQELEDIFETLFVTRDHSLLTITGERGIGKTMLAQAIAKASKETEIIDECIYVGITAESSADQVLNSIALQAEKPHLLDMSYPNKYLSIQQLFETKSYMLILDQQEVGDIFSTGFKTRIQGLSEGSIVLVCCAEPWDDVYNIPLSSLDFHTSDKLFTKYISTADFEIHADKLLALTGGSPLAIELVMSAVNAFNLNLQQTLKQAQEFPAVSEAEKTGFHYTRLLNWLWRLLDAPSRKILASFQDFNLLEGPDISQMYYLHSDTPPALLDETLQQLTSLKLIALADDSSERYRWHSLLNEFLWQVDALAQADDSQNFKAQIRARFCDLYMDYLVQHAEKYHELDIYQRNLLHAFQFAFEHQSLTLEQVNLFLPYLTSRGRYQTARQVAGRAVDMMLGLNTPEYVELLLNIIKLDQKLGESQAAESLLNEALKLATDLNAERYYSDIYQQLGIIAKSRAVYKEADSLYETALEYARKTNNPKQICPILANLGVAAVERGDYRTAKRYLQEALDLAEFSKQPRIIEFAHTSLGVVALEQLDFALAIQQFTKAQEKSRDIGSPERKAYNCLNTGAAYYYLGQYEEAEVSLEEGLKTAYDLQHEELVALLTRKLGRVEAVKGHTLKAENFYKRALIIATDRGITRLEASLILDIAKLHFQIHNQYFAERYFQQAFDQALKLENYDLVAEALFGLAIAIVANTWIIGSATIEETIEWVQNSWDKNFLHKISDLPITWEQMEKAEFYFQHGLINFPEINRYHIVEAIMHFINLK